MKTCSFPPAAVVAVGCERGRRGSIHLVEERPAAQQRRCTTDEEEGADLTYQSSTLLQPSVTQLRPPSWGLSWCLPSLNTNIRSLFKNRPLKNSSMTNSWPVRNIVTCYIDRNELLDTGLQKDPRVLFSGFYRFWCLRTWTSECAVKFTQLLLSSSARHVSMIYSI